MLQPDYDDLIGVPFLDGGRDPKIGLDCWGLALEVFRRHGITLPDFAIPALAFDLVGAEIERQKPVWRRLIQPESPSVIVMRFNSVTCCNHCGVYIGFGQFIHTRERVGVCIDRIMSPSWARRIDGYYLPA